MRSQAASQVTIGKNDRAGCHLWTAHIEARQVVFLSPSCTDDLIANVNETELEP